jgi:hypothetical protein
VVIAVVAFLTIRRRRSHRSLRDKQVAGPSLSRVRAVPITGFGGPEVLEAVDAPEHEPGPGLQFAQGRDRLSCAGTPFTAGYLVHR